MSLQTAANDWRADYDNSGITGGGGNPVYIGSIQGPSGYHTGAGIYQTGTYQVHEFNWYAGQGLDDFGFGSKYLVYSECGFNWNTVSGAGGKFDFVTEGSLDKLYLGYNPSTDTNASPASATLTSFNTTESLLVVSNFDLAVDYVADSILDLVHGAGTYDGNDAVPASVLTGYGLLANGGLYDQVTLNAATIYDAAFNTTATSTFEFVLDQYLTDISGGTVTANSSFSAISSFLASNSDVRIDYHDTASDYVSDGVVTETLAQQYLDPSECDLLLAA